MQTLVNKLVLTLLAHSFIIRAGNRGQRFLIQAKRQVRCVAHTLIAQGCCVRPLYPPFQLPLPILDLPLASSVSSSLYRLPFLRVCPLSLY